MSKKMRQQKSIFRKPRGLSHTILSRHRKPCETTQLNPLLHLHQTLGNHAIGRFIQEKLKVIRPDDNHEHEAGRVASAAMRMLEPQIQRQAADAFQDYKLQSWMDPTGTMGTTPDHVASIYFTTKNYLPVPEDEAVIKDLAEACLYTAKENIGIKGRVVGHADIRPSSNPTNEELSSLRAIWVERSFIKYLQQLSRLEAGHFNFESRGEGVTECLKDPRCRNQAVPSALAAYRRADIFVYDSITIPTKPMPPELKLGSGLERWLPLIRKGDKETIKHFAMQVEGDLTWGGNFQGDVLFHSGVRRVEPPWWKDRASTIPDFESQPVIVQKGLLLHRDYKEFGYWSDKVFGPNGSYSKWAKDTSAENRALLDKEGGYFLFISDSLGDLAEEILKF